MLKCQNCQSKYFIESSGSGRVRFDQNLNLGCSELQYYDKGASNSNWTCSSCSHVNYFAKSSPYTLTTYILGKKGGGCFIATAAYGTPYANEVTTLNAFRDNFLLNHSFGRTFVKCYYFLSPPIASLISKSNFLKMITRVFLIIPLVKFISNLKIKE